MSAGTTTSSRSSKSEILEHKKRILAALENRFLRFKQRSKLANERNKAYLENVDRTRKHIMCHDALIREREGQKLRVEKAEQNERATSSSLCNGIDTCLTILHETKERFCFCEQRMK